jgi:hypothetical protein
MPRMALRGRAAVAASVAAVIAFGLTMRGDMRRTAAPDPRARHSTAGVATHDVTSDDTSQDDTRTVSIEERADALARAQVSLDSHDALARDRSLDSHDALVRDSRDAPSMVECRFAISDIGGTTPKFHCVLSTGIEVRVKYGRGEELPAEAAATRLLAALGFGADHITMVERLRCHGCPKEPFYTMKIVEATRTQRLYERVLDDESHEDFTWVAMERKFEATAIEAPNQKGWAFYELDAVDPHRGGAPRAHVDALRLLAVFLAHWDNKADNQRLVCLSTPWPQGTPCREPFLLLQDVGSTFGPLRLDLEAWERSIIWADRATCTVSMRHMPYGGATFRPIRISEDGRQFLIKRLGALSDAHVTRLLSWARFDRHEGLFTHPRPIEEWVRVFKKRVQTLIDGPPCPA